MGFNCGISYEPREDVLLLELMAKHRRCWKTIEKQFNLKRHYDFPKRTTSSLRNRWQRIARGSDDATNVCARCGEPKMGHVCSIKLPGITSSGVKRFIERVKCLGGDDSDRLSMAESSTETVIEAPTARQVRDVECDDGEDVLFVELLGDVLKECSMPSKASDAPKEESSTSEPRWVQPPFANNAPFAKLKTADDRCELDATNDAFDIKVTDDNTTFVLPDANELNDTLCYSDLYNAASVSDEELIAQTVAMDTNAVTEILVDKDLEVCAANPHVNSS